MSVHTITRALAVVIMSSTVAIVRAQQPSTAPDQKPSGDAQTVTVTGCVQPETAVLKRTPVAGNIGMGDEYVVTFATLNPGAGTDMPKPDVQTPPPSTGAAGSTGFGKVYRLTGDQEKDLKGYVSQRVEIVGRFKDKDKTKDELSSIGTTGRTGDLTPDNTPEIVIDSFKPGAGSCTPISK